jgi:hypothetical protein
VNICRASHNRKQISHHVVDDMPFSAFDFFVVNASLPACRNGFCALRIDYSVTKEAFLPAFCHFFTNKSFASFHFPDFTALL